MTEYATPQEQFWAGEFGDEYPTRNVGPQVLAANLSLFARVLTGKHAPETVLELGANIGMNLKALSLLFPSAKLSAVEINAKAAQTLGKIESVEVFNESILTWNPAPRKWDLVLIKGVLIHMNPDALVEVYEKLAAASARQVLICEYFNPVPVEVTYRGHAERMYKRDWCAEFLNHTSQFRLIDYGFVYRHDPAFPDDDFNWFLLERT